MGGNNCKSFSPKNSGKVKSSESGSSTFSCKSNDDHTGKTVDKDYIEDVVCKETEIQENEMKLLPLGSDGGKILLIKQQGELHAIGTKCTHYGALLHTGALGEGRIRCPWHGACFNIKTGDIEDYPGLDSLPCYKVTVDKGEIKVRAKHTDLTANRRTKGMCKLKDGDPNTVIIVGGGPAGATCAETLRQEGFEGRIVMVCREAVLPYDRVKVSKTIDFDVQKALLRSESFYNNNNIETKLGVEATSLNTEKQIITLGNGEELHYNYLFIATGSKPRKPDIEGVNLKNIFVMRDYTDSQAVHKQIAIEKHVVVLGTGFIGMEAAAYCSDKCASVTIIGRDSTPFKPVFGEEIGQRIKKEFEGKGIKFISNNGISKFIAKEDNGDVVNKIELQDGTILAADIVILGIGSTLYTDWLKESGIKLLNDGCVEVNEFLKTNIPNVYAGGDIAHAPVFCAGVSASIGHYPLAHYHGKIAAMNICKKETPLKAVPFFWTTLFGRSYRYAGFGKSTEIKIHGSLEDFKFFAYYFKDDKVIAMSSVGRDPIVSDFANFLHEGKTLSKEEVEKDPIQWIRNKPKDLQASMKQTSSIQESKSNSRLSQQRNYHTITIQRFASKKVYNIKLMKYSMFICNSCKLLL